MKNGFNNIENQNLVSIITPAYNCEKYVSETIESVQNQTYTNWEMIIVNDKSNDNTEKIINKYAEKDNRIRIINLIENSGAAVARNIAIENAKGRFIAFLDSDDRWKKNKLENQLEFMLQNKYGFTFTGYEYIKDENNNKDKIFKVPHSLNYNQGLKNTVIGCLTVIIDKDIVGDFRMPLVRRGQDNLTWLNLLKEGHIAYGINENLAEYRKVEGSLSNDKRKALKRQWYNYRTVIKLPFLKCVYYYSFYVINNVKKYYFSN
jgi:teichuronic acid biosynthesis glycosyltransferase TuaG